MSFRPYPYIMQAIAAVAAFVVVSTYAFGRGSANAIDFAVAIALTLAGTGAVAAARTRGERAAAGAIALTAAWTVVVTAGVFSGASQRWLTFAAAVGIATIASAAEAVAVRRQQVAAPVVELAGARAA